jgi:septal ring factor EnvC (AmiA/AmiB activator)
MANQYIKVTLAGETKSHIIMATLRDFYLSQGAKVEIPTEEEVLAVFPRDGEKQQVSTKELEEARAAYEEVKNLYNKETNKVAKLKATNADLQEKVNALQTSLDEAENVIANLQKQLKAKDNNNK